MGYGRRWQSDAISRPDAHPCFGTGPAADAVIDISIGSDGKGLSVGCHAIELLFTPEEADGDLPMADGVLLRVALDLSLIERQQRRRVGKLWSKVQEVFDGDPHLPRNLSLRSNFNSGCLYYCDGNRPYPLFFVEVIENDAFATLSCRAVNKYLEKIGIDATEAVNMMDEACQSEGRY